MTIFIIIIIIIIIIKSIDEQGRLHAWQTQLVQLQQVADGDDDDDDDDDGASLS